MSSNTKLSHSQIARYSQCAKSYQYHYIDKLRPTTTSGALLFGSALDSALNILLLENDLKKAKEEFVIKFTDGEINGEKVYIPTSTQVVYAYNDFDSDLLDKKVYKEIKDIFGEQYGTDISSVLGYYKELTSKKSTQGLGSFNESDRKLYSFVNWLSMRAKGMVMLKAYKKKILPKINKVLAVQKEVLLENEDGDSVVGFIDLIADIKDYGVVVLDNKTSAREYAPDSVVTSPQLALYMHSVYEEYKTRKAGYIVLRKNLMKNRVKVCSVCEFDGSSSRHKTCNNVINNVRCNGEWTETIDPDVFIQFIIDEIPEQTEALVLENANVVNEAIKANIFPRNLNSCNNYYGGQCAYYDLCYKNKPTGLIKKES